MKSLITHYPIFTTCLILSVLVTIIAYGMTWVFLKVTEIGKNEKLN